VKHKKKIMGVCVATMCACSFGLGWGYNQVQHERKEEVRNEAIKNTPRNVEYEVASIEGDEYLAIGNEFDKYGMRQGIKLTPQQVGKRLEIGDKVVGVWEGKNLVNVIAK